VKARRAAVLAIALCAAAAVPAAAAAEPFTLEATGSKNGRGKVRAIGDFHPERNPTLGAATAVFGTPAAVVERSQGASCRTLWPGIGLRILFVNLGGGSACDPALGKAQVARAFDPRWHTGRGLGIGDRLRRLKRLYPAATRHGRSWWLVKGVNIFGARNPYPVLRATMNDRRVRSFALSIGAAGD
jgi:hypothetical protein